MGGQVNTTIIWVRGQAITIIDANKHTAYVAEEIREARWEQDTFDAIDAYVTPGSTFLDIGAWIGVFTIYAANRGANVVCLEPDPVALGMLYANCHINNVDATVIPKALWTESGHINLALQEELGDSMTGVSRTGPRMWFPCIGIPQVKELCPSPSLLKVDIEGAEGALWGPLHDAYPDTPTHLSWHLYESGLADVTGLPDYPQVGGSWCYPTYLVAP